MSLALEIEVFSIARQPSHTARARRAPVHQCHYIPYRLVERVSGPTIGAGLIVCAPHTRRAPGVPRTTQRCAPSARLTLCARQARARPSTSRKKEKDFGRLERKRERKRLVESVSGSRNKSVCIASQPPRARASHNTDVRAQHVCARPSTSIYNI